VIEKLSERTSRIPKSRLESLTDLIFGLALSIGSLSLLAKVPSTPSDAYVDLSGFAFSFLILISIWFRYTGAMSLLPMESLGIVLLNTAMLFLISIEPYLLGLLTTSSEATSGAVLSFASEAYALDLAGLMLILGIFAHKLTSGRLESIKPELVSVYRRVRNTQYIVGVWFAISALPFFWTWQLLGTQARIDMWYFALVFIGMSRLSGTLTKIRS